MPRSASRSCSPPRPEPAPALGPLSVGGEDGDHERRVVHRAGEHGGVDLVEVDAAHDEVGLLVLALEALGLDMEAAGKTAEKSLAELGICFLFAKNHHPAMRRIQPIRQKLGVRTIFNLMGPLSNPAGVSRQLIGIARPAYVSIYANAKAKLGTVRTFIVSGDEGLDELSLDSGNELADVRGNTFEMRRVDGGMAGLPPAPVAAIRGGDARHNAGALVELLQGARGPYRNAVLFNAAATLIVAGKVDDWIEGANLAAETLDSGKAAGLLGNWIEMAR